MSATKKITPTPHTPVSGQCRWEKHGDEMRLNDEAGVTWQTHWIGAPADQWAGSVQRHETMADNF